MSSERLNQFSLGSTYETGTGNLVNAAKQTGATMPSAEDEHLWAAEHARYKQDMDAD